MLGKLARWLRILGYDAIYARGGDRDIVAEANREGRILLTRDKELASKGFLIKTFSVEDQLKELLDAGLIEIREEKMMTRCPLCNSLLKPIEKESVRGKVPEKSFESSDSFWYCDQCKKYYWIGKHWIDIKKRIDRLTQ